MKKKLLAFLFLLAVANIAMFMLVVPPKQKPAIAQSPSRCVTDPINFVPNKKLLPLYDPVDANNE